MTLPTLRIDPSRLRDIPLFSTGAAEADGISRKDLAILVRRQLLWQPARGWYSARPDATEDERHILRTVATLRLHGEHACACRHSALLLHGLPLARCDLSTVEIARSGAGHGRTRDGVRVSRLDTKGAARAEVEVGLAETTARVVDVATAIVGTAMTTNPLGALVAGDHALRHRMCTRADTDAALDRSRGGRGIAAAREALGHLEPRHESPGETLAAAVLRRLPWAFEPQVEVRAGDRLYRLDFGLREHKVAFEFDGAIKYTGPEVMEAQLAREANLRAEGWVFVRAGWDDLDDDGELRLRVLAAIHEARPAA
ncbi:hypothetical protein [Janibacter sp. GS2]|uniref:hypothetical protein n=1 Tax=Janibacter sp. GS2 TaxID=3442646 RepID=UPI003EBC0F44